MSGQAILNKAQEIRRGDESANAGARAATQTASEELGRVLFKLDVNIGGDFGTVPMPVHDGAVPADVAKEFATKYDLPDSAVAQLTQAIIDHAKKNGLVK